MIDDIEPISKTLEGALEAQQEVVSVLRAQMRANPETTGTARELSMALMRYAKLLEITQLEQRVKKVEAQLDAKP